MAKTMPRMDETAAEQSEYDITERDQRLRSTRGPRYEAAELGFRHYWYPALLSRHLGKRPKSVEMLGEKLVFIRANGRVHALFDRCAHRGVALSEGDCLSEGTITCPYHGWTYSVADGKLIAALTDGPDSGVAGKKGVRSYPVEERNRIIYVYMGDGNPPPLEEDVPEELLKPEYVFEAVTSVWGNNWRATVENGYDASHASYLHRYSFRWRSQFNVPPGWGGKVVNEVDGKYLMQHRQGPMGFQANFPGVGVWPRHSWIRKTLAKVRRQFIKSRTFPVAGFRLPSVIVNHYSYYTHVRWSVPVDPKNTRNFQMLIGRYHGLRALAFRLQYWLWHRWVFHKWFNEGQDRWILERLDYSAPEQLFRPDSSIVGLRKYVEKNARMGDPEPIKAV
ncbi:MAG: Rieske 2Fe-2S domain-containing protein [Deltaproteobacteria bacterium]|nr:Rieske 2Fe-2S domain-containing protein [Deltaproteobacteria bacterium]